MKEFEPSKVNGKWYEPITIIDTKEGLRKHIKQLKKYRAEYVLIKRNKDRVQLAIPKKEYDRIDKKYHMFWGKVFYKKRCKESTALANLW